MTPISAQTCTQAWLDAALHLEMVPDSRDYTVILEIANPMTINEAEKRIFQLVDSFLTDRGKQSLNSIINTIFPANIYAREGADAVIEEYQKIAKKIRHHPDNKRWGTYAFRMLTKRKDLKEREFTPLEVIIQKMRTQLKSRSTLRAAYEMSLIDPMVDIPIYNADTDRDNTIGGPCLSHVSFKLKDNYRLLATAFYRSHYYVQRALGNLYGLAWLQDYVAQRVGVESAELVCISSMAVLEPDKKWSSNGVTTLLRQCVDATRPRLL